MAQNPALFLLNLFHLRSLVIGSKMIMQDLKSLRLTETVAAAG